MLVQTGQEAHCGWGHVLWGSIHKLETFFPEVVNVAFEVPVEHHLLPVEESLVRGGNQIIFKFDFIVCSDRLPHVEVRVGVCKLLVMVLVLLRVGLGRHRRRVVVQWGCLGTEVVLCGDDHVVPVAGCGLVFH
jgi:hypothetical protein